MTLEEVAKLQPGQRLVSFPTGKEPVFAVVVQAGPFPVLRHEATGNVTHPKQSTLRGAWFPAPWVRRGVRGGPVEE